MKQVPGTCFMYGEPRRRLPTSQSLCTSVFRAICGEWGNTSDALHKSAKWQEKLSQIAQKTGEICTFTENQVPLHAVRLKQVPGTCFMWYAMMSI